MALTKAQLAEMIAEENGFAKNKSVELVENLIEIIKDPYIGKRPHVEIPNL